MLPRVYRRSASSSISKSICCQGCTLRRTVDKPPNATILRKSILSATFLKNQCHKMTRTSVPLKTMTFPFPCLFIPQKMCTLPLVSVLLTFNKNLLPRGAEISKRTLATECNPSEKQILNKADPARSSE